MQEFMENSAYAGMVLTLVAYAAGVWCKKKTKMGIFNPILVGTVLIILFLQASDVEYATYETGAKYISYLLTPATVALAIPLYRQLELLKKNMKAILIGSIAGVLMSLGSVLGLSILFGLSHKEYVTLLPKSITTAIGMGISEELGGIVTITVAVIVVTGILGNMIAESLLKLARVEDPLAKGLAIGTSSHALGTAKAIEIGEIEGAMSGLAIAVSGLLTVAGATVFANFY